MELTECISQCARLSTIIQLKIYKTKVIIRLIFLYRNPGTTNCRNFKHESNKDCSRVINGFRDMPHSMLTKTANIKNK